MYAGAESGGQDWNEVVYSVMMQSKEVGLKV